MIKLTQFSWAASESVTVLSALLTYPFDLIRRRIVMSDDGGKKGVIGNFKEILSKFGWQSLYTGAGAGLISGLIDWFCLNISDSFLRSVLLDDLEEDIANQAPDIAQEDPQEQVWPQDPPQRQ
jgi:hypothetical protein